MIKKTTRLALWVFFSVFVGLFVLSFFTHLNKQSIVYNADDTEARTLALVIMDPGLKSVSEREVLAQKAMVLLIGRDYYSQLNPSLQQFSSQKQLRIPATQNSISEEDPNNPLSATRPRSIEDMLTVTPSLDTSTVGNPNLLPSPANNAVAPVYPEAATPPSQLYTFNTLTGLVNEERVVDGQIDVRDPIYSYLKIATLFPEQQAIIYQPLLTAGIQALVYDANYLILEKQANGVATNRAVGYAVMADSSKREMRLVVLRTRLFKEMVLRALKPVSDP